MSDAGMTEAATAEAAVPTAAAAEAAVPATTPATTMGRRRDHRTGCEGRHRGQRNHHFAQHDLFSI
jgi:hypothetical protein